MKSWSRREFLRAAGIGAASLAAAGCGVRKQSPAGPKPNVLFISVVIYMTGLNLWADMPRL